MVGERCDLLFFSCHDAERARLYFSGEMELAGRRRDVCVCCSLSVMTILMTLGPPQPYGRSRPAHSCTVDSLAPALKYTSEDKIIPEPSGLGIRFAGRPNRDSSRLSCGKGLISTDLHVTFVLEHPYGKYSGKVPHQLKGLREIKSLPELRPRPHAEVQQQSVSSFRIERRIARRRSPLPSSGCGVQSQLVS